MNAIDRIPMQAGYAEEIGKAVYAFAYLEWNIIYLAEKFEAGSIQTARPMTAGDIAKLYLKVIRRQAATLDPKYRAVGEGFKDLCKQRNMLVHGNPITAAGGEQRLRYSGRQGEAEWTSDDIRAFANAVADLAIIANGLYHER